MADANLLQSLSYLIAGLLEIVFPVALAIYVKRKLGASYRVFLIGCIMFLASLIRIPLNNYASLWMMGIDLGQATMILMIAFPSFTAGIFEECARYIAYRSMVKDRTLKNGFMYGVGHGGIESIVLVGVNVLVVGLLLLTNPSVIPGWQLIVIEATPFYLPFVGFYERIMAIIIQIGLSIIVLESFRSRSFVYLAAAVFIHFVINFTALMMANYGVFFAELITTVFALGLGYWSLKKLRAEKISALV